MADPNNAPALPDYAHKVGCPQPPDRQESYEVRRADGRLVRVTRCIECAADLIEEVQPKRQEGSHA